MFKLCFILFLFISLNTFASNKYIDKAIELKLYDNKDWLNLNHYKKSLLNDYKSIIVNNDFFISKNGRTNPKEELIETIKSFYDIKELNDNHSLCKYPARLELLNKYLHFENLPRAECKEYEEFFNEINPESLSIIFPTSYMNNPASMFGHTLIKINGEDKTSLNSIIINYGADTQGEISGIIFAFRGVFGLYYGFFSAMAYYRMINLYNNTENRDIWEYDLNFNKKQSIYYTKHIWELIHSKSRYYFFKQNCSYYILETLNILVDDDLTKDFNFYTAPIETIKLLKNKNFITDINYRPSLQKQIQQNDNKNIKKILKNQDCVDCNYNDYETAYKLLQYKKSKGKITLKDYRKTSFRILKELNNKQDNFQNKEIKQPAFSPEYGHNFTKMKLLYNKDFLDLELKLAYHELIDSSIGFNFGSEINFFDLGLRYNYEDKDIELEKFNFLNIKSLALHDNFFKPTSFSVLFGINNLYNNQKILLLETNGGITLGNELISIFALFGPKLNYSGTLKHNGNIGLNITSGVLLNFDYFKSIFTFKINKFLQNEYNYNELIIDNNIILNKNLYLNIKYEKYFYKNQNNDNFLAGFSILF